MPKIKDPAHVPTLSIPQAVEAYEHASSISHACDSIEALDKASNYKEAIANCPDGFTEPQKLLAHRIILLTYERAIGRRSWEQPNNLYGDRIQKI